MEFWERVKILVIKQNTKLSWVAETCGFNTRTFQGWITKEIMPNADQAYKIAKVLDTSVEYLITGIDSDSFSENEKDSALSKLKKIISLLPEEKINDLIRLAEGWIPEQKRKEQLA